MTITFRGLLRWGILAFVLHNGEEALTMPTWLATQLPMVARQFGLPAIQPPSVGELQVALLVVTVVPGVAVWLGARGRARSAGIYGCLLLYAILWWNAWVPHLTTALVLRRYTPGVLTAVLVNIPYTVVVFRRALHEGEATRAGATGTLLLAAVAYPLIMWVMWGSRVVT